MGKASSLKSERRKMHASVGMSLIWKGELAVERTPDGRYSFRLLPPEERLDMEQRKAQIARLEQEGFIVHYQAPLWPSIRLDTTPAEYQKLIELARIRMAEENRNPPPEPVFDLAPTL